MPLSANAMTSHSIDDHRHWPSEGQVFEVNHVELAVRDGDHPFHLANVEAAKVNWTLAKEAKPALFDGQMALFHRLGLSDGQVVGDCHMIPYSTYLLWRQQADPESGYHLFCFPVLFSSDGALIAVEMGAQTANAGLVYCAAGSLDQSDIVDGYLDIEGNMRREVKEETGLSLEDAAVDPQLRGFRRGRIVTLFRRFYLPMTADEVFEKIEAHMVVDHEQEIARPVALRSSVSDTHRFSDAMQQLLDWVFPR
ncbi:NUDIX hydrolase [Rhizobium sp.]|jgi:8-oxo-dGTP pyrophosphatase MutT (NUDIX family)|uniref:NUDIX hydrolase n=1 Tax=Rhizobium sp. TaxID=391 RepID=UPI002AA90A58